MHVTQKAVPLLVTLLKIQRKYQKSYSWPSQMHIIALLADKQQIKRSRATLNRWLRDVEDSKYIVRRRRIRRDPLLGTVFKSTLYKITIRGYRMLTRAGVNVVAEIRAWMCWRAETGGRRPKNETRPKNAQACTAEVNNVLIKLTEALSM